MFYNYQSKNTDIHFNWEILFLSVALSEVVVLCE